MSREAYYDVIRKPVITEKSTIASETIKLFSKWRRMPIRRLSKRLLKLCLM